MKQKQQTEKKKYTKFLTSKQNQHKQNNYARSWAAVSLPFSLSVQPPTKNVCLKYLVIFGVLAHSTIPLRKCNSHIRWCHNKMKLHLQGLPNKSECPEQRKLEKKIKW